MPKHKEFDFVINLQGDMPIIKPQQIKKVINPLKHKYSIGTLATNLKRDEVSNKNVTKVSVKWDKNNIGQAKEFFRYKNKLMRIHFIM